MAVSKPKELPPKPAGTHLFIRITRNQDADPVWKYEVPKYMNFDAGKVETSRKSAVARRDHYIALQKEFGADRDRESARWAKDEATDALKEYRAACLILGHLLCEPPGDSPFAPEWEWPVELAPWLDRVLRFSEQS